MKSVFFSLLPIPLLVFVLHVAFIPLPTDLLIAFVKGTVIIIAGLTFFLHGMELSIMPIGSLLGSSIMRSKKVFFILISGATIAFLVAVAEPNLLILGKQVEENVTGLSSITLLLVSSIGLAVAITLSLVRSIFQVPFKLIIFIIYALIFLLSPFTSELYVSIALDAGGAITGPLTVPFIISFGVGSASVRGDIKAHDDNFGYTGLGVASPVLLVLLYAAFMHFTKGMSIYPIENPIETATQISSSTSLLQLLPSTLLSVFISILPVIVVFFVFQFCMLHLPPEALRRIIIGFIYSYIGLCLFFLGTNTAFIPMAETLGKGIACLSFNWIAIPIAFVMGGAVVCSEPSAHALMKEVEEVSEGNIRARLMLFSLAIGTSFFVALALLRIFFELSIWAIIIPSYILIFVLLIFSPSLFSAIAFDSGSVASGPISSAFVLPMAMGFSAQFSSTSSTNAFGLIAMTSLAPLITIQILGILFEIKKRRILRASEIEKKKKE